MSNRILNEDLDHIDSSIKSRRDEFNGASVLVTGCAGFLGYYLLQYLVRRAKQLGIRRVVGLDSFILGRPEWLSTLCRQHADILEVKEFDISRDSISEIEGISTVSLVIHAASIASPTFYRKYPLTTITANIWGLRQILDYFRDSRTLKGMLFFSSSEIYGDPAPEAVPTSEEYRGNVSCVGPRACYDESKRFGETMCWVYSQEYGLPVTVARPFNNFGPGMSPQDKRLPADLARAVLQCEPITIHSDGTPTRTFCYVADAVSGYLLALLYGKYDYFNIGTEKPEIAVQDFASLFATKGAVVFDYKEKVVFRPSVDPAYMTDNPTRRAPNIDKARKLLGYNPTIAVGDGIERYLRHLSFESQR